MVLGHDIHASQRTQDIKITEDHTFDSMLLFPNTLKGLNSAGFHVPSPIQLHGIPWGKCGCDLLLEAKSGTGKTAVFSVIALEQLNLDKGVQTLILAPTREIASQICDVIRIIGTYYKGLSVAVVMGGLPYHEDVQKFKDKVHIVVGSPGRLRYLIQDKHIDVSSVRLMVLDEADKLVDKSFLTDINYIFSLLPHQKQVIMSSATYSEDIRTVIDKYVRNPLHIRPDSNSILLGIQQQVTVVPNHINVVKQTKYRYEELIQILSQKQFKQCMVFCNYTARVDEVHRKLNNGKWPADKLCGQQEQTHRLEALKTLQAYNCRIMVTTDLTARGIDAPNVDLVINFELPHDWQTYLHRIGRAGRFGSYGTAITILCEGNEESKFKNLLIPMNMQFNLTYLWSKEPYALTEKPSESQNDESQLLVKIPEKKLSAEDMYEELWKMLSDDLSVPKNDVLSFKSLCDSFEDRNQNTKSEEIENFQDLLSSFQNHEIKSRNDSNYKPIIVNNLIIPCDLSNHGKTELSSKTEASAMMAENKKIALEKGYKSNFILDNEYKIAIDSKENKILNGESIKTNLVNARDVSKSGKIDNVHEDSDRESCSPNDNDAVNHCVREWKPDYNKPSGSKDFLSTDSEYDDEKNAMLAANLPVAFGKSMNSEKTKHFKTGSKPDYNKPSGSKYFQSPEYDDEQNAMLAANLPVAFGKSINADKTKIFKSRSKPDYNKPSGSKDFQSTEYYEEQNALFAANLPVGFGKSIKPNKTKKYNTRCNKLEGHNQIKINENQENKKVNQSMFPKTQENKSYVYNTSDSDEHTLCEFNVLDKSSRGRKSIAHKTHYKSNAKQFSGDLRENPYYNNDHYYYNNKNVTHNNEIGKRQQQFDQWYRELQNYMLWIERYVYIAEISKPY